MTTTTRIVCAALLALALLAIGAQAAPAASTAQILRDCGDDGALQGDYTASELRKARKNLPTDTDEYSDCRDVLRRAELVAGAKRNQSKRDDGSSDDHSGSPSAGTNDDSTPPPPSTTGEDGRPLQAPQDTAELDRLAETLKDGGAPVTLDGKTIRPGKANAAAGDADLPGPLILVLVLLGIAAVGSGAVLARKRVLGRHAS